MMSLDEVFEALRGYAVMSVSTSPNFKTATARTLCEVVIGNAGRDMFGTRTFRAASFETIIRQIKKVYGEIPAHLKAAAPAGVVQQ
jgi:hypothetical protein